MDLSSLSFNMALSRAQYSSQAKRFETKVLRTAVVPHSVRDPIKYATKLTAIATPNSVATPSNSSNRSTTLSASWRSGESLL